MFYLCFLFCFHYELRFCNSLHCSSFFTNFEFLNDEKKLLSGDFSLCGDLGDKFYVELASLFLDVFSLNIGKFRFERYVKFGLFYGDNLTSVCPLVFLVTFWKSSYGGWFISLLLYSCKKSFLYCLMLKLPLNCLGVEDFFTEFLFLSMNEFCFDFGDFAFFSSSKSSISDGFSRACLSDSCRLFGVLIWLLFRLMYLAWFRYLGVLVLKSWL